jgi:hypothetical protein
MIDNNLVSAVKKIMQEELGVFYEDDSRLTLSVHTYEGDPDIIFFKDTEEIMIDFTTDVASYSIEDSLSYHFEIIKKINDVKRKRVMINE